MVKRVIDHNYILASSIAVTGQAGNSGNFWKWPRGNPGGRLTEGCVRAPARGRTEGSPLVIACPILNRPRRSEGEAPSWNWHRGR